MRHLIVYLLNPQIGIA